MSALIHVLPHKGSKQDFSMGRVVSQIVIYNRIYKRTNAEYSLMEMGKNKYRAVRRPREVNLSCYMLAKEIACGGRSD